MKYYEEVGAYYDQDVELGFEDRAMTNESLQRIRDAFRSYVEKRTFSSAIEIGCGPGFDAEWFGNRFPEARLTAIDVSQEMCNSAAKRCSEIINVEVKQGTEHDLMRLVDRPVDLIYVFFGALNTVEDLDLAAQSIYERLEPGGHAVLTFVNKWYLRELIVNLLKLRPRIAFARIRKIWGGYSVHRHLPSSCYTPRQIRNSFQFFKEIEHQGYSILYPAWYNHHKVANDRAKADRLWEKDRKLNTGPFWKYGEYTLFVFRKPAA